MLHWKWKTESCLGTEWSYVYQLFPLVISVLTRSRCHCPESQEHLRPRQRSKSKIWSRLNERGQKEENILDDSTYRKQKKKKRSKLKHNTRQQKQSYFYKGWLGCRKFLGAIFGVLLSWVLVIWTCSLGKKFLERSISGLYIFLMCISLKKIFLKRICQIH